MGSHITKNHLIFTFILIWISGQILYFTFNCASFECLSRRQSTKSESGLVVSNIIIPHISILPKNKGHQNRKAKKHSTKKLAKKLSQFFRKPKREQKFTFIIPNEDFCGSSSVLVLNFVLSAPHQSKSRTLIRSLWGHNRWRNTTGFYVVHLVGTVNDTALTNALNSESEQFNDIIQVNINDVYENLSQKVLAGLNWVKLYCPSAEWVMKSDSDVFVNTFRLSRSIKRLDAKRFGNRFICKQKVPSLQFPCREKCLKSSYEVSREEYPFEEYPPHCHGPAYIMTKKTSELIRSKASYSQPFRMEDVYFTGIIPLSLTKSVKFTDLSPYFPWRPHSWKDSFVTKDIMVLELEGLGNGTSEKLWEMIQPKKN